MNKFALVVTITGVNLCTLFVAILIAYGYLLPYLASFLRIHDPTLSLTMINSMFYFLYAAEFVCMVIFEKIIKVFGLKDGIIICSITYGLGMMLGYFGESLYWFYMVIFIMGVCYLL